MLRRSFSVVSCLTVGSIIGLASATAQAAENQSALPGAVLADQEAAAHPLDAPAPATQPAVLDLLPPAPTSQPSMSLTPPPATQPGLTMPMHHDMAAMETPGATTYTIKEGDTFGSLAKKLYGAESKWTLLAKANPTVDPKRLKIGQVIKLPAAEAPVGDALPAGAMAGHLHAAVPATAPATGGMASGADVPSEIALPAGKTYTVQEGDTFWTIAEKFYGNGTKWESIYRANRQVVGSKPDALHVGMKLIIPAKPRD